MADTERKQRITWWCGFGSTLCPYSALLRLLTSFLTCSFPCSLAFAQTLFGVGRFLVKPFVFSQVLVLAVREVKNHVLTPRKKVKKKLGHIQKHRKQTQIHAHTRKDYEAKPSAVHNESLPGRHVARLIQEILFVLSFFFFDAGRPYTSASQVIIHGEKENE